MKGINPFWKVAIVSVVASLLAMALSLDVGKAEAPPATIYIPDDYPSIQAAVDAANPGDTIIVRDGTYTENVDVNKDHLTIQSQNGADSTIVQAANPHDSVFDITAAYVNLNGFTVTGSTGVAYQEYVGGIYLRSSAEHCNIFNNKALNNSPCGIGLYSSRENTFRNNTMLGNIYNFAIDGEEPSHFTHDIDTSNIVDGKPIYYWVNQHDKELPNDAGFVTLISCTNITASDLVLTHNFAAVMLISTTDSRVENITTSDNFVGIGLIYNSNNNTISDNVCNYNDLVGIVLDNSSNNTISANACNDNTEAGICLEDSSDNIIYLNNFVDNGQNADSFNSANIWHSPEEITYTYKGETHTSYLGNYWSDYNHKYPNAEKIDETGIWDTPYSIDSDSDNYPLVEPFENYEIFYAWAYDADDSGYIEIGELLDAISDYIGGKINISQLLEVIRLYISHTQQT